MATKAKTEAVMEEKKEEAPKTGKAYWMERVPFYAFKDNGKYSADIFVGLNGTGYQIERGKEVMIPRAVAEIAKRSMVQDQKTAQLIEKLSSDFANESRRYG